MGQPYVSSFRDVVPPATRYQAARRSLVETETEENGAVSAYVPGLPVYAAADSHAQAERAIRAALADYLNAHPASRPDARVRVARVSDRGKPRVSVVGVAALVGAKRSDAKARASRANGRLGGRPPKSATRRTTRTKTSR
jgi:hypothetical protein